MKSRILKQRQNGGVDGMRYMSWFDQARYDLAAAAYSKIGKFFSWSCYQSVQSVEKAVKSVIIHGGWTAPRTHKLSVLIGLANNVNDRFRSLRFSFRDLEVYTYVARYPFVLKGEESAPHIFITEEEGQRCFDQANFIVTRVEEILRLPESGEYTDYEKFEEINLENRINFVKERLVEELSPEKIILFGSYAKGGENLLSTLDILVIGDTDLRFIDRIKKIREITKGGVPVVEPLHYTKEEFTYAKDTSDPFITNAIEEGRILFSKDSS